MFEDCFAAQFMPERAVRQNVPVQIRWRERFGAAGGGVSVAQLRGKARRFPGRRVGHVPKVLDTSDRLILKLFLKKREKVGIFRDAKPCCVIYLVVQAFLIFPTFLEVSHHPMSSKPAGKKRMSQSEVVNHFAEKFDLKRAQVKELFEELSNLASREVKENGEFQLPGFGKLVLSERKAREGRNPQTGETIQIPPKTVLKFRVGKGIKDSVVPKK
jgi:DNA-binding protein HU-beta